MGNELLQKPHIAEALEEWGVEMRRRYTIEPDNILAELAKIAFSNVGDLYKRSENGGITTELDLDNAPEPALTAIASIEEKVSQWGTGIKISQHDKLKALEMLGRYQKMWVDKVEVDGGVDAVARLREARRRANLEIEHDAASDEGADRGDP
jgi:hypothetical protein